MPAVDAASRFADFAADLEFKRIPAEVVDCTKKLILDQLGVMLVGRSAAGVPELAATVREWGGAPEASILGYGFKAPAPQAALVNGTMARAHDYDALHERAIVHITAGSLPQCLAVAERRGGVSGQELITAMVAGMEFMIRLGISYETNFLHTGRVTTLHQATFGGALAASKLMKLDRRQTVSALGLAYGQVSGNLQVTIEGTVLVRVLQGFAAQTAVQSAVLAERGLIGPERVLQGEFGYFRAYHDNRYDAQVLLGELGERFEIPDVSIKYYPCCFLSHFAIEGMLQLVREASFTAGDVETVRVRVTQGTYNVVCSPQDAKRKPATTQEALFSLQYCVAASLVHGRFGLEQMTPAAIGDASTRALAQRISTEVDAELERTHSKGIGPCILEVALKDGRRLTRRVDYCKGHPKSPMSFDDCADKFRDCASFSNVSAMLAAQVIERVSTLETATDVSEIIALLA
ncbi:MAG TPA: MmgE/PrpD family protein [Burkholderiales bacterium]|nr:MmgE/PrpD family protein [Burkholderiales bacterium]